MTREELQVAILSLFSSAQSDNITAPETEMQGVAPMITFEEGGQFLNGVIDKANLVEVLTKLKADPGLSFHYLFCLTCVDYKTHFMMMYHLRSIEFHHELVIKVKLEDIAAPAIDSVSRIFQTANFHEREVFDLFGVKFYNHPDLRRIFLDENWPGFPLRKSYEDPNMIEL